MNTLYITKGIKTALWKQSKRDLVDRHAHRWANTSANRALGSFLSFQIAGRSWGETASNFPPTRQETEWVEGWRAKLTRQSKNQGGISLTLIGKFGSEWSAELAVTTTTQHRSQPVVFYDGRQERSLEGKTSCAYDHMTTTISHVMGVQPSQPLLMRGLRPGRFVSDTSLSISWPFCLIAQANWFWTRRENLCHVIATQTPPL